MSQVNINDEIINEILRMYQDLDKTEELASELLRIAQDRFGHVKHKLNRNNREVSIDEKTLWKEVWHAGKDCEAGGILSKKYPEVFEAYEKQNRIANDIQVYVIRTLKIDYKRIKLSDIIRLCDSICRLRFRQLTLQKMLDENQDSEPISI